MTSLPSLEAIHAQQSRLSLAAFIRHGWHVLEPGTPCLWNWHIDAIAEHLQVALEDWMAFQNDDTFVQRIQNLLINVPPGTAKSRIVSVFTPAWMWLRWPSWKSIFLSSNRDVALRDSVFCRDVIESEWYRRTFQPEWQLVAGQNAKGFYRNTAGGSRRAITFSTRITGSRADAIFVDDPHDAEEAKSKKKREYVNERWDTAIGNRVNDLRCSLRIGIMQRLDELDWSGTRLLEGGWEHLCIPMHYDPELARTTIIGWNDPRSVAGEVLHPARFTPKVLAAEKVRLGSAGYAGQMQQRPAPATGNLFKKVWFRQRYRSLPELVEVFTLWDTAMKAEQENDESACLVGGVGADGNCYVLRVAHGRWETPDLAKFLVAQAEWLKKVYGDRYKGDYVEDKVSGTTLIQYVRRTHPRLALIAVKAELDKVARAHGVTPLAEARRVWLPDTSVYVNAAEWVNAFIHQVTTFPSAGHDDIVDVFVYWLKKFLGTLKTSKGRKGQTGGVV